MQPCASYQFHLQNHLLHLRDLELSVAMVYVDCPKAFFKLSQIMDKSASEVKPLINVFFQWYELDPLPFTICSNAIFKRVAHD